MINTQGKERECGICLRAVIGDCMISSGKYYHKHCMTCSVCGDGLNGTYFTFLDKLICEKDYKVGYYKLMSPDDSQIILCRLYRRPAVSVAASSQTCTTPWTAGRWCVRGTTGGRWIPAGSVASRWRENSSSCPGPLIILSASDVRWIL